MILVWVYGGGIFLLQIVPVVLNTINLDADGLSVYQFPHKLKIHWKDILYAEFSQKSKDLSYLFLATKNQDNMISLRFYDFAQIWSLVKNYLPLDSLDQDAEKRLYEIRQTELERLPLELNFPLKTSFSRWLKGFFWVSIIFYAYFSIDAYQNQQFDALFCFTPLFLIMIAMELYFHQFIHMDLNGIYYKSILGSFAIRWDEIEKVVSDTGIYSSAIGIWGKNKRLVVFGPFLWSGKDKENMIYLMVAEFKIHDISIKTDKWLLLKTFTSNKNARVKN